MTMMIEPEPGGGVRAASSRASGARAGDLVDADLGTDRHAVDPEPGALAVVGLDQDADRVPAEFGGEDPRRRPDPALELVADHPRPATDVAFRDRAAAGGRRARREGAPARTWKPSMSLSRPSYVSPTTGSDQATRRSPSARPRRRRGRRGRRPTLCGVGDRDRRRQLPGLADPLEAGQLAVAVEPVAAGEDRFAIVRVRAGRPP